MQDLVLAFENLGSLSSKENEFKIRISFRGPSADFEKVKGGHYLKEILILNSFCIEDKEPRF